MQCLNSLIDIDFPKSHIMSIDTHQDTDSKYQYQEIHTTTGLVSLGN